jgi:hypothetical protein
MLYNNTYENNYNYFFIGGYYEFFNHIITYYRRCFLAWSKYIVECNRYTTASPTQ